MKITNEEAIKMLKEFAIVDAIQEDYDVIDMAIEALEKQIPMKITDKEHCPNCKLHLGCEGFEQAHCDNCGQKLDWEEAEMKKIFEFGNYKGNYVMNCKTEEEARDFCELMHEDGRKWTSEESYEKKNYWETHTCYDFNNGRFGNIEYYVDRGDIVLEWSDFIQDPRETTIYRLSGYDVEVALEIMRIKYTEEQLYAMIEYIEQHNLVAIPYVEYMTPMIEMAIEEGVFGSVPFEPKEGDVYYYPNIGYMIQVANKNWYNSPTDIRIKKYVGCYRTKEEAIAKAKELWGLIED